MLKTNEKQVVEFLLQCQPGQPVAARGWSVGHDGAPFILPSIGGITLNIEVGDPAFGWAGDHLEPGVSACIDFSKRMEHPNNALQLYACVGDPVTVISGKAEGAKGVVLGHHGGSEHLIIDFARKVKEKLSYDDKLMVHAKGQGLRLLEHPEVKLFNLNPGLLRKMKIKVLADGRLQVPVTTLVPAACMGLGVGVSNVASGDYDVMTSDPATVKKYALDKMRFGDFVALLDHDNSYGRTFKQGAISIGVVIHSDCLLAGHGPGITTVMTCPTPLIEPVLSSKANLADLLKIGTARKKSSR